MDINTWKGRGHIVDKRTMDISDPRATYVVTDLKILCTRLVKQDVKKTFVPCEAWGVMSKKCDELKIGDFVEIIGRFENKQWMDKDKNIQKRNLIVVEKIEKYEEDSLAK